MTRARKSIVMAVAGLALLVGLLAGPAATWLQAREARLPAGDRPDALYLVAGARDQSRRVAALAALFVALAPPEPANERTHVLQLSGHSERSEESRRNAAPRTHEHTTARTHVPPPPLILIGNDTTCGRWCRETQRNPIMSEWAARRLNEALTPSGWAGLTPEIVPGLFTGTDGEMEALGRFLHERPDIRSVALVSSPFHLRRLLVRLRRYAPSDLAVFVVAAEGCGRERHPFWVGGELIKLARDRLGLARAPLLSRGRMPTARSLWLVLVGALLFLLGYAWLGYPLLLRLAGAWGGTGSVCLWEKSLTGGRTRTEERAGEESGSCVRAFVRSWKSSTGESGEGRDITTENAEEEDSRQIRAKEYGERLGDGGEAAAIRVTLSPGHRVARHPQAADLPNERVGPRTAVLIAAHNEAAHIRARIVNLLEQSHPPDSVWIGVDGSDDGTAEAAAWKDEERDEGGNLKRGLRDET